MADELREIEVGFFSISYMGKQAGGHSAYDIQITTNPMEKKLQLSVSVYRFSFQVV